RTRNESSSPLRHSSITTRVPASPTILPESMSPAAITASSLVLQMTTPLPAAKPSAFTTTGVLNRESSLLTSAIEVQIGECGGGSHGVGKIFLAKALLDPSCAAVFVGPKTAHPRRENSSTTPSCRGSSGPTTVRSGLISLATDTSDARLF